jgi:hypothetical protein
MNLTPASRNGVEDQPGIRENVVVVGGRKRDRHLFNRSRRRVDALGTFLIAAGGGSMHWVRDKKGACPFFARDVRQDWLPL